jgi:hypothetical protein
MTNAHKAGVAQQLIDSSKNLAQNVQKTETGNVPLQQGMQDSVQAGRTQGAIDTTPPSATQIGPQEQRPAMLTMPKPPSDLTAPPEQVASEAVPQARPVSSTELSTAAAAQDVGESPDVKNMIETRKTSEGLESKVQTAAAGMASKEKIANEGNETKILIAGMRDKRAEQSLQLKQRENALDYMKFSHDKRKQYVDLLEKAKVAAATIEINKQRIISGELADPKEMAGISAKQEELGNYITTLEKMEHDENQGYGAAADKTKPLTTAIVQQLQTKYGITPEGRKKAKAEAKKQGYKVD